MEDTAPSPPKIRFRRLRIAWSVLAAGACIWLVAFWVRSYLFADYLSAASNGDWYEFASARGELRFSSGPSMGLDWAWTCHHQALAGSDWWIPVNILGFRFATKNWSMIPYWFVLLVTAGIGIVPWMRWSFGLRTMLIVVTIIAAVLGLARFAAFSN